MKSLSSTGRSAILARAAVKVAIDEVFDKELPDAYTRDLYQQKCEQVFQHIYDIYADATHSIYAA